MKKLYVFILILFVVAAFQGCDNRNSGSAGGTSQKKLRLGVVVNAPSDFMSLVRLGCDSVVRGLDNVDLDFRIPIDSTAEA